MHEGMKRVLCVLENGVEEAELVAPVDVLRRAEVDVVMASFSGQLEVTGKQGFVIKADRLIYKFDAVPDLSGMAPQGFAQDTVIDPSQQDEHSADPSGIRNQGRIHVADSVNKMIHVYGALGSYLLSYPQDGSLTGPSDVAIHAASRRVFVADPGSGDQRELEWIASELNERVIGKTLEQTRRLLDDELQTLQMQADRLIRRALSLGLQVIEAESSDASEIVIATRLALLDQPEFSRRFQLRFRKCLHAGEVHDAHSRRFRGTLFPCGKNLAA